MNAKMRILIMVVLTLVVIAVSFFVVSKTEDTVKSEAGSETSEKQIVELSEAQPGDLVETEDGQVGEYLENGAILVEGTDEGGSERRLTMEEMYCSDENVGETIVHSEAGESVTC